MSEQEGVVAEDAPVAVAPRERLSWKDKAVRLYESRQVAREQTHKMQIAKQVDQFRESLNQLLGSEHEPTDLRYEIDGVTFVAIGEPGPGHTLEMHLEFRCKDCGHTQHQLVRGLADVGAILTGHGEPHVDCPKHPSKVLQQLTPGEKLLEALRGYLAEELEQV